MLDAERIVFEIVPSILGLFLVAYSIAHIRRMRADFFTVIRGWVFTLFLASLVMLWTVELVGDLLGSWPEQARIGTDVTFIVVVVWLSTCLVALNTRYRRFSTLDHFSDWMKGHPVNLITVWGAVGLFVIVYAWAVNPMGDQVTDEPLLLAAAIGYLAASVAVDFVLPFSRTEPGLSPRTRFETFGGMKAMTFAWMCIPIVALLFDIVLGF
ncbi:MAG: hypothetical protein AB7S97_04850, partial [Thermoplasmata archaeon]